jgi:hypothetical protein
MTSAKGEGKSKTASVLLAVFLTFWTWLYTVEKDWWKFVVGLVVGIAAAVLHVYLNMPIIWLLVPNYTVWIWAIVDVAIKKNEWYRSYFVKRPIKASNGTQ